MIESLTYLGPMGTFSEQAANLYAKSHAIKDFVPMRTITEVGNYVIKNTSSSHNIQGIVPIENSIEGSVNETLDLLIQNEDLYIQNEIVLAIEHSLITQKTTNLNEIKVIYSHPQAIGQCRNFIEKHYPNISIMVSISTSEAVTDMKNSTLPAAAIANKKVITHHSDCIIAQENIQDNINNETRFIILAMNDHKPTKNDRTSICFFFDNDEAGQLFSVIKEFSDANINLVKIESRPTKTQLGEYLFLIDCNGHRLKDPLQSTLKNLGKITSKLNIFGSYPIF